MAVAAAGVAALLLLLLRPARYLMSAPGGPAAEETPEWGAGRKPIVHGEPPFCRKSASIAVLPGEDNNLQLLVWSGIGAWGWVPREAAAGASLAGGMADKPPAGVAGFLGSSIPCVAGEGGAVSNTAGAWESPNLSLLLSPAGLHKSMFDDLHRLDMAQLRWTAENASSERPWGGRWKAGNAQVRQGGGVVWHWCRLVLCKCTLCQARQAFCKQQQQRRQLQPLRKC